jgi:hypothetical protein
MGFGQRLLDHIAAGVHCILGAGHVQAFAREA